MKRLILVSVSMLALVSLGDVPYAATQVGVTAAVNPKATGEASGRVRTLVLGDQVVFKEKIDTSGEGLVQVLFIDGSTITVGPNASLVIDEYVYDPNAGTGKITASVGKGALRFIGGKISKQQNAVNINTVVGTVGIRGGMADLAMTDEKSVFSLLYGRELTFRGKNCKRQTDAEPAGACRTSRVYKIGYSMEITGGVGALDLEVRRTTAADASFVQRQLTGNSKYSGGAKQKPTNETVAKSKVPAVNSENTVSQNTPPTVTDTLPDPSEIEDIANDVVQDATQDVIQDDIDNGGPQPPEPEAKIQFRALSAAQEYELSSGVIIEDPGSLGLIGGDPGADQVVIGQPDGDELTGTIGGQSFTVPFSRNPGVLEIEDVPFPGGTVSGNLFVGASAEFFFYSLFPNGDIDQPIYAFGGTATPASGLLGKDQLLTYELRADPRQGISMPFMRASLVPNANLAAVSNLFVMTPNNVPLGNNANPQATGLSTALLGGLLIQGQGASQNSAVVVFAGGFTDNGQGPSLDASRRGSVRTSSTSGSISLNGSVVTVAGPNGNHLFGQNGENFVLSNNFSNGGAFEDEPYRNNGVKVEDKVFGTMHVANQIGAQSQSTLTRSTHTYTGFAAGMLEWRRGTFDPNRDGGNIIPYRSEGASLVVNFDAGTNTIGGTLRVDDVLNKDSVSYYQFGFGYDPVTGGQNGVYVDDDRYGAVGSNNPNNTHVVTDDGAQHAAITPAATYFIGSELAVQNGLFPSTVTPCACKFLEWGYWGTQVNWDPNDGGPPFNDFFHLGTWVAGDITKDVDMPQTGTATFNGHAVGNVARTATNGQTSQYLAAGKFGMTWNFAQRTGNASIRNFDGINVSGKMNSTVLTPSRFGGGLAGTGVNGNLSGAFVNGPAGKAQGVIGNFDLSGAGFLATGIVAAQR